MLPPRNPLEGSTFDAVLIPGGGVRAGGSLPPWVTARFDRAVERAGNSLLMPLSGGTPHRPPPLDDRGFPIFEARAGADYLVRLGVDPARILIEASSYDTIGNAYFSRVIHAGPRTLDRFLVVTSAFHMPRTRAVFEWVYSLPGSGCAKALEFETTADTGIAAEALAERIRKEEASLAALEPLVRQIRTMPDLHEWLFSRHDAYAAGPAGRAPALDVSTY